MANVRVLQTSAVPFKISTEVAESTKGGSSSGQYFSPSKIKSGGSARFHILDDEPVCGFSCWAEDAEGKAKPFRWAAQPSSEEIDQELGDNYRRRCRDGKPDPLKAFVAFRLYNYTTEQVELAEITQKSIITQLDSTANSDDFEGDFSEVDFSLAKEGSGLDTRYTLNTVPKKKGATATIEEAREAAQKINVQALLTGENPFKS